MASQGLLKLVNLYLNAARTKARYIALVWPAAPRTLVIVHVLATLERWAMGDKQGIRGITFPVKTNAFYPLNHLHLDRNALIAHAQKLLEQPRENNKFVTRRMPDKDSFIFSIAGIKSENNEFFNPTMSELIPHFFAGQGFKEWESCSSHLLEHISAKLARRAYKKALSVNREIIGNPKTAPDALFGIDARMSKQERHTALLALKEKGVPEVILVDVTRHVRQGTNSWAKLTNRICEEIEQVFEPESPGVLIVTDEPHAVIKLQHEINELNKKQKNKQKRKPEQNYSITGVYNGNKDDGLLPPGVTELEAPAPREFNLEIVDTEAACVINQLYQITRRLPNNQDTGRPLLDAASYISRLAALPCGVSTLVEWLTQSTVSDRARRLYSWATYHSALSEFERSEDAGAERYNIQNCLAAGTKLYENYNAATPFALRLAKLTKQSAQSCKHCTVLVFTNATYRRLAERFLTQHDYLDGVRFEHFSDKVIFTTSSQLEERLTQLDGAQLVFVGLDEEGLRLTMTDNRILKHTDVLMTQRAGQYLRTTLQILKENFSEFKILKPRMESFLRQLSRLPDSKTMFVDDFVLPTFRTELSSEISAVNSSGDPDAWSVVLEDTTLYWKPAHKVYVYDPASSNATDHGFRTCEVASLQPGDKLFVMSSDL